MVTDSPLRQLVDKLRKYDVAHNFREITTIVFPRRLIAHTREIFSEVFETHKPDHLKPDHENPSTRNTKKKIKKAEKNVDGGRKRKPLKNESSKLLGSLRARCLHLRDERCYYRVRGNTTSRSWVQVRAIARAQGSTSNHP